MEEGFEDFQLYEKSFSDILNQAWSLSSNQVFAARLQHLKNKLLSWNKFFIDSLETKADNLVNTISYLQKREESGLLSVDESINLKQATTDYLTVPKQIEVTWAQKAHMQ